MRFALPLLLLASPAMMSLAACGLRPLYAGGSQGATARALGSVEVAPIPGKAGWLMRNAINDRIRPLDGATPRYRLEVVLDDKIEGFGIRSDDAITRERRTLRARYKLVDLTSDTVQLDATAGSDVGIDVTSSTYATVAAEDAALERLAQTVADQIVTQIAMHASAGQ